MHDRLYNFLYCRIMISSLIWWGLPFLAINTSYNFVWKCFIRYMNFFCCCYPKQKDLSLQNPLFMWLVIRSEICYLMQNFRFERSQTETKICLLEQMFRLTWNEIAPKCIIPGFNNPPPPPKALPLPGGVIVHCCYRMYYISVCQINADYYAYVHFYYSF